MYFFVIYDKILVEFLIMGIWFWFVLAFISFAFITLVRKRHDYAMLYTIAIGFAINANIFNSLTTPMYCGHIVFAIDSILYTGFMYCVIVCAHEYGIRNAKILTSATIAAILLSASIELLAKTSATGFQTEYLLNYLSYLFSSLGTFAGVWLMLFVYKILRNKKANTYLNFITCIVISSIVNTTIFYIFTVITTKDATNLAYIVAGSYLGKFFCIALCLLSYFISTHWFIPNNLKEKYKKIEKEKD